MGFIWENSFGVFLLMTVVLGGGAAWLTGRALAQNWRPLYQFVLYMLLLNSFLRFLHYALFQGTLLSLHYYLVDLIVLFVFGGLGFRLTRVRQMVTQYSWLYERAGPLSWRER